jgi:hypothetical protein
MSQRQFTLNLTYSQAEDNQMSVQLGINSFFPNKFDSHYCEVGLSSYSYIYQSNHNRYQYLDPEMDQFSYLPVIKLKEKQVIFTINPEEVIYYENAFFSSLPKLLNRIKPPKTLDQDLLDKIALIANYLAQGKEYEYLQGTAKQQGEKLTFLVKKRGGESHCRVTLPNFQKDEEIQYEEVDPEEAFHSSP